MIGIGVVTESFSADNVFDRRDADQNAPGGLFIRTSGGPEVCWPNLAGLVIGCNRKLILEMCICKIGAPHQEAAAG